MIIKNEPGMLIRQAKVTDVEKIALLIKGHADQGRMLPRSRYKVASRIQGFVVVEDERQEIVGCGALVILWEDLAEIQSLVVALDKQGQGYGKEIVSTLIAKAAALGIPKILALTYQIEFFSKMGFAVIEKDSIPRKIWGECLECPKLEQCDETAMIYQVGG
jgi:amino-acid N-acetyltransferase